mmetsp:Transcript_11381/g.12906  ORF Transcript_11381/g.12906 Transcript_11381/m.12906 type:complete len:120 (+) Transcript_11381:647-1006(+)
MHISQHYSKPDSDICRRNHTIYINTVGRFKDRIENLYFTYAFALSAFQRIQDDIPKFVYSTYNQTENQLLSKEMNELEDKLASSGFQPVKDEDLFTSITKQQFVNEIQPIFLNITRIIH